MEEQPSALLQLVLFKVNAADCARAACVARLWREIAHQEILWKSHCQTDYSVTSLEDPLGNPCVSWKATYWAWRTSPLLQRTTRCWATLRGWMQENFQEVADSLVPGASRQELQEAETSLGCHLPPAASLLYQQCNGQKIPEDEFEYDESTSDAHHVGLIGGYYFSNHYVNVHLLSLHQVVKLTKRIVPRLRLLWKHRIIIAASSNSNKFFFLDCDDGNVYVGTRNLLVDGEMMVCVPEQASKGEDESKDGMLRWLEWYAQGLQSGIFAVRTDEGSRSISLYPEIEPHCTTAITNGVQVRCSGVFVPELSLVEELENSYWFSYSVRMRLLHPTPEQKDALTTCQLSARHWVICANDKVITEVRADAVIGRYPLLGRGDEEFVYESCTGISAKSGSLEGDFTFVPGRISLPQGPPFTALVARFPLEVPQYIY